MKARTTFISRRHTERQQERYAREKGKRQRYDNTTRRRRTYHQVTQEASEAQFLPASLALQ